MKFIYLAMLVASVASIVINPQPEIDDVELEPFENDDIELEENKEKRGLKVQIAIDIVSGIESQKNKTGYLTWKQFKKGGLEALPKYKNTGIKKKDYVAALKSLFKYLDVNNDTRVSKDEVLQRLFQVIDRDGNGGLS